ncbi:MAG: hypothetical protein K6A44_04740 [bacterium]|nr:hypothetical protein [bacterium]
MGKKKIGFWGVPKPEIIKEYRLKYPNDEFVDLCMLHGAKKTSILPDTTCKIISNIMDNAIHFKDDLDVIIASVGQEKCDSGRFVSRILKDMGYNMVFSTNENYNDAPISIPISTSNLPLGEKITKITANIVEKDNTQYTYCKPQFGFWGVPPNDFEFLKLFPNETHVFGWTRCVEAGRPADTELEMYVDENLPTVFFAQTFCNKMQLAKYLAKKYGGLFIDVDDYATNSTKAKIQAYMRLG